MPSYRPTKGTLVRSKWAPDSHLIPHPSYFPRYYPKMGCIGVYPCNKIATELPSNNLKGSYLFLFCIFTSYNTGQVSKQCHAKVEKET